MHIHSQNNWQTLTNKDNTIKLITNQLFLLKIFILTRSYAALRAADLDWIVGPGYSLGRVHSGINKNVTDTKRDRRGVTTDLGGGQGRNKQKRYRHKT